MPPSANDVDAGEGEALEQSCSVFLVAAEAVEGFGEHDVEAAVLGVPHQPSCTQLWRTSSSSLGDRCAPVEERQEAAMVGRRSQNDGRCKRLHWRDLAGCPRIPVARVVLLDSCAGLRHRYRNSAIGGDQ
jgi:hypothetical protein